MYQVARRRNGGKLLGQRSFKPKPGRNRRAESGLQSARVKPGVGDKAPESSRKPVRVKADSVDKAREKVVKITGSTAVTRTKSSGKTIPFGGRTTRSRSDSSKLMEDAAVKASMNRPARKRVRVSQPEERGIARKKRRSKISSLSAQTAVL